MIGNYIKNTDPFGDGSLIRLQEFFFIHMHYFEYLYTIGFIVSSNMLQIFKVWFVELVYNKIKSRGIMKQQKIKNMTLQEFHLRGHIFYP